MKLPLNSLEMVLIEQHFNKKTNSNNCGDIKRLNVE